MTRNNPFDRFDQFTNTLLSDLNRSYIGVERVVDGMRNAMGAFDSYPPMNVERISDDEYRITVALSGFKKSDIDITTVGDMMSLKGQVADEEEHDYLYRGIGLRSFDRKIQLAKDIVVQDATMKDGLLTITLIRDVPEEMKPQSVKIK